MVFLASQSALEDAGWFPRSDALKERTGVFLGAVKSHLSPVLHILNQSIKESPRVVPAEFIKHLNIFGTSLNVLHYFDFRGPSSGYGSACAAGQCSIAEGYNSIVTDDADVMVVGNTDHGIHPYLLNGLSRLGALNKKCNDSPETASRPFDEARDGFVAADGAGVLILEELGHAQKRNARIYAELRAVSLFSESFHPTRPQLEGEAVHRTMTTGLQRAGVRPEEVGVVHSHGTSTIEGDNAEAIAISRLFAEPGPAIMGIKSNLGHMMAGVGGIQAAALILAMKHGLIPPILNLHKPLEVNGRVLDFVRTTRKGDFRFGISNNAGFGGLNCSLLFEKY